jgi:hypothetical protein
MRWDMMFAKRGILNSRIVEPPVYEVGHLCQQNGNKLLQCVVVLYYSISYKTYVQQYNPKNSRMHFELSIPIVWKVQHARCLLNFFTVF